MFQQFYREVNRPMEKEYSVLLGRDSNEDDLCSSDETISPIKSARRRRILSNGVSIANVLLFAVSLGLIAWSSRQINRASSRAWKEANYYSPITDEADISYHTQQMKGTLIDYEHDIYRQSPSPAVDRAWEELTEHGFSYVTGDQARRMGWDTDVMALMPPDLGAGEDKYSCEIDVIHKVHCLNMIRKDVYFDHYWGATYPDGIPSERHRIHTSHCIYILLQSLMCNANTDLIPHVYLEDYEWPVPDFQINRKCGNFEAVREWNRVHSVPLNETTTALLERQPGQKTRPLTDEFRRLFEVGQ